MSTYQTLRDRALDRVGCLGQTEAQTVAQTALEEAMRFVAFHIRVPSLVASATATAPASPELETNAIALSGGAGTFQITSGLFQCPDRLYIKKDSTVTGYGTPYEFLEYPHFIDLQSIPSATRVGLYDSGFADERPRYSWTITPSDKVWASPIVVNNVLTLFYRKAPAAYSALVAPEILPIFDYILVNAAEIVLKEWLREPAELTTMWMLFNQVLMADVQMYDSFLNGRRKRSHLKIHRSYRA